MVVRRLFIAYLFVFLVSGLISQGIPEPTDTSKNEIDFISDTQAPMWVERLWLKYTNNRQATKLIFDNILSREPKALFLLGDVVNLGSSNRQWKSIDNYLQRLRAKGVGVFAALGNHEVMGRSKKGERKFQQRFPSHVKTGYVEVADSVAVILLNSNFRSLTRQEENDQLDWYKKTLDKLEGDSSVYFIITGCHHSPYTNSSIVSSSIAVRAQFVPLFLKSPKSRLFLSGHSHNFEHYKVQEKDFLVIGGGGGLHQPLRRGARILPDLASMYKPMFHYLTTRRSGDSLQVTSIRLKPDFSGFEEGMKLTIKRKKN